jgi:branched-chain amino acid transport system permease protein
MRIFVGPSIGWATVIRRTKACQIEVISSRTMFAQQLVNGLMLGGAYALVAIGYTLIFGVLNLLHLAHGEVFMVGAYVGLALALAGFSPWVVLAGAMLGAATLGVLVERVAFRPVRNRGSHVTPLITTIAVGLVLQHVVVKIFGAEPVAFPAPFAAAAMTIGPVTLTTLQLLILGTSLALMALLELVLRATPTGMAIRATAENQTVAGLMGINVSLAIVATFAIASALAGAAGVLLAWNFTGLSPFFGVKVGLKGLAIMLLGGLGNVTGAMLGGLIVGVVEVMSVAYLASSYRDAFAFAVMILILLVRPTGLLGARLQTG